MLTAKDVAIVILNWNGRSLLERFLPSVVEHSGNAAIYIADNASTDDSLTYVGKAFPTVKIIRNTTNGGYAKGYNDALKNMDYPILCLLNNDVAVTSNWLDPIMAVFNNDQNTAIAQPKLLDHRQRDYFEYAGAGGGFIDKYGFPYCRGRVFNTIEQDQGQYNDVVDVFWASGACFFIKTPVFNELGGFDASYFAHMEEIDLCWRAFNKGHTIKYVGTSTVYHLGGGTLHSSSPKKTYLNFRNSLFTVLKNSNTPFSSIIMRLLLDGIAGLRFLLLLQPLHLFAIIKAHLSFYGSVPRLFKARKHLNQRPDYYKVTSIVWSYFIRNKKRYNG